MNEFIVKIKHDRGVANVHIWASDKETAQRIVLSAEKAPDRAVLGVRYAPITQYDLKYRVEQRGTESYYFTRRNMRFAGDTMRNYGVRAQPVEIARFDGSTTLCWELYRRDAVKMGLRSSSYFDVNTYEQVHAARA